MFVNIVEDLNQFTHGPTLRDKIKVLLLSPGFFAVVLIRIQATFFKSHLLVLAYFVHRLNLNLHGIDVLPGSRIKGGLHIEHPVGIVIGAGVDIGKNCTILQGVTLGAGNVLDSKTKDLYPKLGDNVIVGANSSILGSVVIGDDVKIGAHCIVLHSLSKGTKFFGSSTS